MNRSAEKSYQGSSTKDRTGWYRAALEYKGWRNERSLRKPADQKHSPTLFPHARIRERTCWESNPVLLGARLCRNAHIFVPSSLADTSSRKQIRGRNNSVEEDSGAFGTNSTIALILELKAISASCARGYTKCAGEERTLARGSFRREEATVRASHHQISRKQPSLPPKAAVVKCALPLRALAIEPLLRPSERPWGCLQRGHPPSTAQPPYALLPARYVRRRDSLCCSPPTTRSSTFQGNEDCMTQTERLLTLPKERGRVTRLRVRFIASRSRLALQCPVLPWSKGEVEKVFSQMNLVKNRPRNRMENCDRRLVPGDLIENFSDALHSPLHSVCPGHLLSGPSSGGEAHID
ncbi:hypothetical protein PR048_002177 [Dryococelus australis]|uniref:Uncharacterized protein n=1 Tax=Dryococelus australis TaxID=614101 RepID=A0ABQ9IJL9_9NEOP|nr:hypothetical protein PR048_002177 [Dryococelus australis]